MSIINDVEQKIKGSAQEIEGKIKKLSGRPLAGISDTIQGKVTTEVANLKLSVDKEKIKASARKK